MAAHMQLRLLACSSSTINSVTGLGAPSYVYLPPCSSLSISSTLSSVSLSFNHHNHFRVPFRLRPIFCSSSTLVSEKPALDSELEEFSRTRLLAQNVPWTSTADDIRALFEKHGKVIDVELSMHSKTRNRGLAFVEMGSPEEALEALNKLEGSEFEGRTLKLNYAKPRKSKSSPDEPKPPVLYNLFVANLSYAARPKDLREFFSSNGSKVVSAEVIFEQNLRRSAGYGFVSFATKEEADAALSHFQGKELMGRPIRVARGKQVVKTEKPMNSDPEDMFSEDVPDTEQPEEA